MPSRRLSTRAASPAAVYLFIFGASTFFNAVAFTLALVFYARDLGLNAFSMVLIGSVVEAACFLFGLPTGVFADLYGRRTSVLIGLVLTTVSLFVLGAAPSLALVLVSMVLWGAGFTFVAGALEAWLTEQVGEDGAALVFQREQQVNLAAGIVGILTAGALGLIGLRVPILAAGGMAALTTVIAVILMREPSRSTPRGLGRAELSAALQLAREGISGAARRPLVRALLLVTVINGLSSEAFDRLWTLHILSFPLPHLPNRLGIEVWFTLFALISSAISLTSSLIATRIANLHLQAAHPNVLLAGLVVVQALGMIGLALLGNLWLALVAMWIRDAALVIARPVEAAWLNRNADERSRATLFSLSGQADAIGQVAGGPAIGALAGRSLTAGLLTSGLVLLPAAVVYARAREVPRPTPESDDRR